MELDGATISTTPCRSCGAPMIWARTDHGQVIPIDPEPSDRGNVELFWDGAFLRATVHGKAVPDGRLSHFVTCPNGPSHRKAKQ